LNARSGSIPATPVWGEHNENARLRQGGTAEAIPILKRTLADRERVFGADHPDTNVAGKKLAALTSKPTRGSGK
jgi:hypothetical protein